MIGTFIQGGLGNQLFQIAAGYSHARRVGGEFHVIEGQHHLPLQGNNISTYKDNILRKISFTSQASFENCVIYREESHEFKDIPDMDGIFLMGYFQSEKYFKNYKSEIADLFRARELDENIISERYPFLKDEKVVSLHVRRGDYLKFPEIHPTMSLEYYKSALDSLEDKDKIIIFSDDLEWCKKNFDKDVVYSDLPQDYLDLYAMSKCYHHIICNSSFSWWGAWLSNTQGKVIAPKTWFGPQGPTSVNMIPERWTQI